MSKKRITLYIFLLFIFGGYIFLRSQYRPAILMYHHVSLKSPAADDKLTVSLGVFRRQMAFLKTMGYRVIALRQYCQKIKERKPLPARSVIITFDDGYEDNYLYAFPLLKEYGYPATIFLLGEAIGKPGYLSWQQIKQMQASGLIDFGGHTLTHHLLTEIKEEDKLKAEICLSKDKIEEGLARGVDIFCYPAGRFNAKIKKITEGCGYLCAVATKRGDNDIFSLRRIRMSQKSANMFYFFLKVCGYYHLLTNGQRDLNNYDDNHP